MSAMLQLDLFGEVEADEAAHQGVERQRLRSGLTCLRDAYPQVMTLVLGDRRPTTGEIKCGASGPWAYSVRKDGFYFEDRNTWGGWSAKPRHRLTFHELDSIIGGDPRLTEVREWSAVTPAGLWRNRYRPYEFWPHPETWHPDYIKSDHSVSSWPERKRMWALLLQIFTDAIDDLAVTS